MNAAFALLEARRAEWMQELASSPGNLKTSISGGAWSMASKGLAADSLKAAASGSVAKDWRKRYGLPRATTFSYKKYTEKVATALALYWRQRLQHFSTSAERCPRDAHPPKVMSGAHLTSKTSANCWRTWFAPALLGRGGSRRWQRSEPLHPNPPRGREGAVPPPVVGASRLIDACAHSTYRAACSHNSICSHRRTFEAQDRKCKGLACT